jgi:CelD/BcsL family acetyltransferase involved in cellulose biosynthesis
MSHRWLTTSDVVEWRAALPGERSAFGSVEFAIVQGRQADADARLLVVEADGASVACPFLVRSLAALPFHAELEAASHDAASPPFTGPIVTPPQELAETALASIVAEIEAALAGAGIVADFTHMHPFAAERRLAPGLEPDREIVWVDTTLDGQRLWRESYSKACRKNVKRAEREGVVVRAAHDKADIAEFHRVYTATMRRNEALESYFFDRDYFQAIFEGMPNSARFTLAEHEGRVIAATLYLHDADDVYSYLGGADHSRQQLRPTNAVVHDTVRWAREQGKRRLILGGGYRPGDGIMRFKSSFSPQRATLELARRVHLERDYANLVAAWGAHHRAPANHDPGYFPAYRAGATR